MKSEDILSSKKTNGKHDHKHDHDHDHSHDHGHDHDHHHHGPGHHHHGPSTKALAGETEDQTRRRVLRGYRTAFFMNLGFSIFEFIGGFYTNSIAVLSDAIHDLGDAVAIGLAWWLEKKSHQSATSDFSYGYRRWSLLSSVLTAIILVVGSAFVIKESVQRLLEPEPVLSWGVIAMAVVGILVNAWSLLQLSKEGGMSERMIRLHFLEDIAGWILVLFSGVIMSFGNWPWVDSLVGAGIAVWILINVIRQLIHVSVIFLQGTPMGLSIPQIETALRGLPGIRDCHHTHIWSLDGEKHVLTTHLVLSPDCDRDDFSQAKITAKKMLSSKFNIFEATIEIEFPGEECLTPRH